MPGMRGWKIEERGRWVCPDCSLTSEEKKQREDILSTVLYLERTNPGLAAEAVRMFHVKRSVLQAARNKAKQRKELFFLISPWFYNRALDFIQKDNHVPLNKQDIDSLLAFLGDDISGFDYFLPDRHVIPIAFASAFLAACSHAFSNKDEVRAKLGDVLSSNQLRDFDSILDMLFGQGLLLIHHILSRPNALKADFDKEQLRNQLKCMIPREFGEVTKEMLEKVELALAR
jgi:hypothetical protein